jgi:hypothetical protein
MPMRRDTHRATRGPAAAALLVLMLLGPMLGGCATVRVSDPPRTATEQFLISQAATAAVQQLATSALFDREVWIDTTYFDSLDAPFVLGELRAHLLTGGTRLVESRHEAQVIVEVRTGGVGIDRYDYLFGLPSLLIPASMTVGDPTGSGSLVTPELAIVKNLRQKGFASVALVAYWADNGELLAATGPFIGRSEREDWWFFGFGPRSSGDVVTVQDPP